MKKRNDISTLTMYRKFITFLIFFLIGYMLLQIAFYPTNNETYENTISQKIQTVFHYVITTSQEKITAMIVSIPLFGKEKQSENEKK